MEGMSTQIFIWPTSQKILKQTIHSVRYDVVSLSNVLEEFVNVVTFKRIHAGRDVVSEANIFNIF